QIADGAGEIAGRPIAPEIALLLPDDAQLLDLSIIDVQLPHDDVADVVARHDGEPEAANERRTLRRFLRQTPHDRLQRLNRRLLSLTDGAQTLLEPFAVTLVELDEHV